jgi:hypothetical protein
MKWSQNYKYVYLQEVTRVGQKMVKIGQKSEPYSPTPSLDGINLFLPLQETDRRKGRH